MFLNASGRRLSRIAIVVALAILVACLHLLLFAPKPTAIIYDEVAHLLAAKYLFHGGAPGVFNWTLKGYSLILYLLALPFGGLQNYSDGQAYTLARNLNVVLSGAFVPLAYAFLRDFHFAFGRALLGSLTAASLPLFFVWTPYAMTDVMFAVVCLAYMFVLLRYFDDSRINFLYLAINLVLAFFVTSIKGVGSYYVLATSVMVLFIYRLNRPVFVFAVPSIVVVLLTRQTPLMFDYGMSDLFANRDPRYALIFVIGCAMSAALTLLYVAPLFRSFSLRWVWDQRSDLTQRAQNALLISAGAFFLPAVAIATLYHAFLGRLTAYRTVASIVPLLLLASIAVFGVATSVADRDHERHFKLRPWLVRAALIVALFATILATKAGMGILFILDNMPDYFTWLPLFYLFHAPYNSSAFFVMVALLVALLVIAAMNRLSFRLLGILIINAALLYSFMIWSWSADQLRNAVYLTNLRIYRAVQALNPKSIILADYSPDVQWLHFAYPYVWNDARKTKVVFLDNNGGESIPGQGLGVIRHAVLNADPIRKEESGTQAFFVYDLDNPRTRGVEPVQIADLVAGGRATGMNPLETTGTALFAYALPDAMIGPFILPAGRTARMTLRLPLSATAVPIEGCVLTANKLTWPLRAVETPTPPDNLRVVVADITPDQTLFGMVRLSCPTTTLAANGKAVTLPLADISVIDRAPGQAK